MTIFILVSAYSDDDGNFGAEVKGIFKTREEAQVALKEFHDKTLNNFTDPDDDSNDNYFDISEEEDIVIRTTGHIVEKEI